MFNYQLLLGSHPFWTPCCSTAEPPPPAVRTEAAHGPMQLLWLLLVWKLQAKTVVLSSRKHKTLNVLSSWFTQTSFQHWHFRLPDIVIHMERSPVFQEEFLDNNFFFFFSVYRYRYIGKNVLGILIFKITLKKSYARPILLSCIQVNLIMRIYLPE